MIRVLELFAGIGACSKALTNLGIEHEIVDAVEIDKYAIKSFNAIHGTKFDPQDITTWDKDIKANLIMHGSPCQDFSVAGRQAGGDEGSGTRSSLLYESLRIIEKTKPDIVIWENVKNLLSKRHKHNHEAYIERMDAMGYDSVTQIMNAKDYGVPQNRERVFTVSIRNDLDVDFEFPKPQELTIRLKDVLEPQVDEKYYLSDEQARAIEANVRWDISKTVRASGRGSTERHSWDIVIDTQGRKNKVCAPREIVPTLRAQAHGNLPQVFTAPIKVGETDSHQKGGVYSDEAIAPTMTATTYKQPIQIKTANKTGFDMATDGDGIDLGYPQSATPRGRVGHGVAKTITTGDSQGTLDGFRIRKLTPRECWRLMGFDDADFDKAQAIGTSNTQLYKQAGNSIVVNCLEAIFNGIEWSDNG